MHKIKEEMLDTSLLVTVPVKWIVANQTYFLVFELPCLRRRWVALLRFAHIANQLISISCNKDCQKLLTIPVAKIVNIPS